MAQDIVNQIWYQGRQLRTPGTIFLGFVVNVKDKTRSGRVQIRIPALHGYCDLLGKNCESDKVTPNSALPWAVVAAGEGNQGVAGSNLGKFDAGQWVLVKFKDAENLLEPLILAKSEYINPIYGEKAKFSAMSQYAPAPLLEGSKDVKRVAGAFNGCDSVVTDAYDNPANGTTATGADKCGQGAVIKNSFAANIADFLKIIQDTDGKIGTKFVDKYTGELFSITNYIVQYTSAITGIFRSAIGWIKAIITKYLRRAIDELVKLIMRPIKGVTKVVNETLEKLLEMVGCTFGNLEALISNLIEDLLNFLLDQTLKQVWSCLDTLVDGILNEILGEVQNLIDSIVSALSSIASVIGSFGDIFGEAINAILDYLGISCGGSNKCGGSDTFIAKLNTPGEYGIPSSVKTSLTSGLAAIQGISSGIDSSTSAAQAAAEEAAKGVDLGTSNIPQITTDNSGLNRAFNTASTILGSQVSGVFDFCNELSVGETTTAVIVGTPETKYDSTYMITPVGNTASTGTSQTFTITRNNANAQGVINFVVWLEPSDTARVVGITTGVTSGGDLTKDIQISSSDYAQDTNNPTRNLPISNNVVIAKKITFNVNELRKDVTIPINSSTPPTSTTSEVTYTAGVFRSTDDLNDTTYIGTNLPNTSPALNTVNCTIKFNITIPTPSGVTTTTNPPGINLNNLTYNTRDQSVAAGSPALFTITRTPVTAEASQIRVTTIPDTAQDGVHYIGGQAIIDFAPNEVSKTFYVNTLANPSITNTAFSFKVRIVDTIVPNGMNTNLGGFGTSTGTTAGSGMTYRASVTYSVLSTTSGTTTSGVPSIPGGTTPSGLPPGGLPGGVTPSSPPPGSVIPLCPSDIIITSPPPTCVVHPDTQDLYLGVIAKTTVAGYTLSYQWQRTYSQTSGWTNVTNGSRSENVNQVQTTFTTLSTVMVSGVSVPVSGWTTNIVSVPASTTYSGATTNRLGFRPSYLLNDEEYYRCIITGVPTISGLPVLTATTTPTYLGVTSSGVFLTTVNCSPTAPSGVVITYSGTAPTVGSVTPASGFICVTPIQPIPTVPSGIPPTVLSIPSGITPPPTLPSNPDGTRILPVPDDTNTDPVTIPAIVNPDGGVISIPIPEGLPKYRSIPLIPIVGAGVGATARAELDDDGNLVNIIVKSKGFGYNPTFSKDVKLCGILSSIELITVGGYFESSPTVYINDDPDIAVASINESGQVVEIRITNPKNKVYDNIPRIDIIGDGFGASAVAVIRHVDCAKVAEEYLKVVNKYSTSTIGTVKVEDCP